jgi:ABC-type phosphate/phosphonate transport system ATPase subunit
MRADDLFHLNSESWEILKCEHVAVIGKTDSRKGTLLRRMIVASVAHLAECPLHLD